ncbi:hypothetical protein E1301_Tti013451 [Triplophysa tibetana]|uniref:Immunoglobulin domain-containing protein n=1 Tax=Triplophysa tibetana TaxID=1572043 RepID=A0A5A9NPC8_9TELE|nr:hypothetical protein E1301_Tti013451 [Triplophysa tibetana]
MGASQYVSSLLCHSSYDPETDEAQPSLRHFKSLSAPGGSVFSVDADEVKSVSVMEGDSVTLHTDLTIIQTSDVIRWRFGEGESRDLLVDIDKNCIRYNGPFKDRLHTDIQTGDLTITNMRIKHSGLYEAQINRAGTIYKRFRVNVTVTEGDCVTLFVNLTESQLKNGRFSWKFGTEQSLIAEIKSGDITISDDKPDKRFKDKLKLNKHTGDLSITNTSVTHTGLYNMSDIKTDQQLTTFTLTVYVMNVSHVSLSWYKGKSLLSSISVSEHSNINISLHLECLDDSYTCVINNPITNQTQHLNTDVFHKSSEPSLPFSRTVPLSCAVVISVMIAAALLIVCIYRKRRQHADHTSEQEITYADPKFRKRQTHKPICAVEDDVVYAAVMTR